MRRQARRAATAACHFANCCRSPWISTQAWESPRGAAQELQEATRSPGASVVDPVAGRECGSREAALFLPAEELDEEGVAARPDLLGLRRWPFQEQIGRAS